MKITSSVEYATRLMVSLARAPGGGPVNAEKLSEAENIPPDYVQQLLLRLRRAGLVTSLRGTAGGYQLSRAPAEITLGQVMRAVEGRILEDVCSRYEGGRRDCHHQGRCGISPVWQRLGSLVEGYLDSVTLARLLEPVGAVRFEDF